MMSMFVSCDVTQDMNGNNNEALYEHSIVCKIDDGPNLAFKTSQQTLKVVLVYTLVTSCPYFDFLHLM